MRFDSAEQPTPTSFGSHMKPDPAHLAEIATAGEWQDVTAVFQRDLGDETDRNEAEQTVNRA